MPTKGTLILWFSCRRFTVSVFLGVTPCRQAEECRRSRWYSCLQSRQWQHALDAFEWSARPHTSYSVLLRSIPIHVLHKPQPLPFTVASFILSHMITSLPGRIICFHKNRCMGSEILAEKSLSDVPCIKRGIVQKHEQCVCGRTERVGLARQCHCKKYVTPPFMPLLFSKVRRSPQSALPSSPLANRCCQLVTVTGRLPSVLFVT
jgi:hypothetical protein